jgi:RNA 3'-terminal phosphate cyclase
MTKLFGYSCVALFALIAQPASAEYWVAVAVNKNVGQHGNSYFLATQAEAKSNALYHCGQFSKDADGCEVVLVTQKCSGMAHAGGSIFVSEGRTANQAGSKALDNCRANHSSACALHETFCPNQ